MKKEEYLSRLTTVISKLKEGKCDGVQEELDGLYQYKPVRLLWYVARAWLMLVQGNPMQGWGELTARCWAGVPNEGMNEYEELHKKIVGLWGCEEEEMRLNYIYGDHSTKKLEELRLEDALKKYYEDDTEENLSKIMQKCLNVDERAVFFVIRMFLIRSGFIKDDNREEWYYKEVNYTYLEEELNYSKDAFVLVEEEKNSSLCNLLAMLLHQMGHPVYILAKPIKIENAASLHSEDVLSICMENVQIYEDAVVIPVCEAVMSNGKMENNRAEILQYLYKSELEKNYGILLASRTAFYELLENKVLKKNIDCLSESDPITSGEKLYFGWIGDYKRYINDIYGVDVEKRVNELAECDFSIVIPARNSAGTLYYTLQTCLNQNYSGSYEIIVSDNSTGGRDEVYRVCKDLDDSRIRYIKTPRDLSLSKSFEFAFLQAKGEFIFSLGSDDGICPWALSMLSDVIKQYPNEEVIGWKRGYYCWKGYPGSKEDEFVIPGQYDKEEIKCYYMPQMDYFSKVLKYSFNMYNLPTMYVNSGFHRSYFNTLLKKTGRLWDGCNQDLYMGVISAAINENVLNIDFPLTLVGISKNSWGYLSSKPQNAHNDDSENKKLVELSNKGDNIGIYTTSGIVRGMPLGVGEFCSLYANILRAIQLGVLPDSWRTELLDYKKIFTEFFEEHNCLDDNYDKYLHYARYVAEQRGEEFLKWFDETIYNDAVIPKYYRKRPDSDVKKKYYKEGIGMEGELVLDASKYGVTNIVEAVKLFEELIYWTPETYEEELEKRRIHD